MKEKTVLAWYFAPEDNRLRHGDNRPIVIGETHTVEGQPVACEHGLHGSRRVMDALHYAPGPMLYRVELAGLMDEQDDKIAAQSRRYIAGFDATDLLRDFARRCALDVLHLWDAPDIVAQYLKTGDESIRPAAWAAAGAAAAARDAARDAAWAAARDAAGDKQNRRLTAMVSARLKELSP